MQVKLNQVSEYAPGSQPQNIFTLFLSLLIDLAVLNIPVIETLQHQCVVPVLPVLFAYVHHIMKTNGSLMPLRLFLKILRFCFLVYIAIF